jgi:hypothetical protein
VSAIPAYFRDLSDRRPQWTVALRRGNRGEV